MKFRIKELTDHLRLMHQRGDIKIKESMRDDFATALNQIDIAAKNPFKIPDDENLINAAILFNDGKLEKEVLANMLGYLFFVLHRLLENNDITVPAKYELE